MHGQGHRLSRIGTHIPFQASVGDIVWLESRTKVSSKGGRPFEENKDDRELGSKITCLEGPAKVIRFLICSTIEMPGLGKTLTPPGRVTTADACSLPYVLPLLCGGFNMSLLEYALWGLCELYSPFLLWLVADSRFRILYSFLARLLEPAVSFLQS